MFGSALWSPRAPPAVRNAPALARFLCRPGGGFAFTGAGHHAPMTEWEIIDALTDGDVSKFGFTYREAYEWLQERRRLRPDTRQR